jgi:hypothetical protein
MTQGSAPAGVPKARRLGRIDVLWASANALLWLVAVGWTLLGHSLR